MRGGSAVLTVRQLEVIEALARGMADKEIAAALRISETAVRLHIRGAEQRLEAKTRAHAVAKALAHKLIAFREVTRPGGRSRAM